MALPDLQKEKLISSAEKVPVVEPGPAKELEPEVKDWLERLETGEEIQLPQPVTDDQGQVIMDSATPQQVTIILPMSEEKINQALSLKIIYSLRWLAEWVKRLTKIITRKFIYKLT